MRLFSIPIEMLDQEDKIFGGYLTLRQVIYILATFVIVALLSFYFKTAGMNIVLNVFINTPIFMSGIALTFIRIGDIRLDLYLYFLVRYYVRPRNFFLKGDD